MIDHRTVESTKFEEGFESQVYLDIKGIPTIGHGTRIDEIELDEATAGHWLAAEMEEKIGRLIHVDGYAGQSPQRQSVLQEMSYWMGVGGCMRFRRMWVALRIADFSQAAAEIRDSRTWRNPKLHDRMERLAVRMEKNSWPS